MREIKFKGLMLCNDNKKRWVYGYLVDEEHIRRKEVSLLVDKKTICQYTALKDKNGVEIYENDIVKNHCGYKAVVKFGEYEYSGIKHCGFYIQDIEFNDVFNLWGEGCKVIGSLYDKEEDL